MSLAARHVDPGRGPLVMKLGGMAVEAPGRASGLLRALAALHASDPEGLVIVHGGGKAVDQRLVRLGLSPQRREGLRVTPADQIEEVVGVLAGVVNKRLVGSLAALGAPAVGLCLGDGGLTKARPMTGSGVDFGLVGEITGGDSTLVRRLLGEGYLPVLSPIATGCDGQLLNVNADDAASALACILGARLLVLLTDVRGVLDEKGEVLPTLDAPAAERLIARGVIHGGMIPKVRAAFHTASLAQAPALIASWDEPDRLLSLGAGLFPGTVIVPSSSGPSPAPAARQGATA